MGSRQSKNWDPKFTVLSPCIKIYHIKSTQPPESFTSCHLWINKIHTLNRFSCHPPAAAPLNPQRPRNEDTGGLTCQGLSLWRVPRVMSGLKTGFPTKCNCCSFLLRRFQNKKRCWGQNLFFIMSYSVCSCIGNRNSFLTFSWESLKPLFPTEWLSQWLLWRRNTFLCCLELEYCKKIKFRSLSSTVAERKITVRMEGGSSEREAWVLDLSPHYFAFSFQPNTQGFEPGTKSFSLAVAVSASSLNPINPLPLLPMQSLAGGSFPWMVQLWLDHFQGRN